MRKDGTRAATPVANMARGGLPAHHHGPRRVIGHPDGASDDKARTPLAARRLAHIAAEAGSDAPRALAAKHLGHLRHCTCGKAPFAGRNEFLRRAKERATKGSRAAQTDGVLEAQPRDHQHGHSGRRRERGAERRNGPRHCDPQRPAVADAHVTVGVFVQQVTVLRVHFPHTGMQGYFFRNQWGQRMHWPCVLRRWLHYEGEGQVLPGLRPHVVTASSSEPYGLRKEATPGAGLGTAVVLNNSRLLEKEVACKQLSAPEGEGG